MFLPDAFENASTSLGFQVLLNISNLTVTVFGASLDLDKLATILKPKPNCSDGKLMPTESQALHKSGLIFQSSFLIPRLLFQFCYSIAA